MIADSFLCEKGQSSMNDIKPIPHHPDDIQSHQILNLFRSDSKSYRIIEHLLNNPKTPTGKLKDIVRTKNVSSLITTTLNPKLMLLGLSVCSEKPLATNNPYNSHQYLWTLCRIKGRG